MNSPVKMQVREKDWSQQLEHMQVPNWTVPCVRTSKRPLSACYTRRICSMGTSHKSVEGRVRLRYFVPQVPITGKMLNGYLMFSETNIVQNVKLIELSDKNLVS